MKFSVSFAFFAAVFAASAADFRTGSKVGAAKERIVGGVVVTRPQQFPWMAIVSRYFFNESTNQLNISGGFIPACGGSVLNRKYILTAAHCFYANKNNTSFVIYGYRKESMRVVVGGVDIAKLSLSDLREIEQILIPTDYNNFTLLNDVALIRLKDSLSFTPSVQPIGLSSREVGVGVEAGVAGWGSTCEKNQNPNLLRYITVRTVESGKCIGDGVPNVTLNREPRTFICAGPGTKIGAGDSGGGLWVTNEETKKSCLIGIVSMSIHCLNQTLMDLLPAVFTRITTYRKWIDDNSKI